MCAAIAFASARSAAAREGTPARAITLGAAFVALLVGLYSAGGWVGAWYHMVAALGGVIVLGCVACWLGARALDDGLATPRRVLAATGFVALACALALQARFAPPLHRYAEWERATQVAGDFERELATRIGAAADGETIDAPPLPMWAAPPPGMLGVAGAAILSDYSVQAWAELAFPERRIAVSGIEGGVMGRRFAAGETAPADVLRVRLRRRLPGY